MNSFNDLCKALSAPATIYLMVTPQELLAIGAVMRVADDDMLEDEGILSEIAEHVDDAFDVIDNELSRLYGDDWPGLTVGPGVIESEYAPDALWGEEDEEEDL